MNAEKLANVEVERIKNDETWKKEDQLQKERFLIKKQESLYRSNESGSPNMHVGPNTRSAISLNTEQQVHGLNRPKFNLRTEAGRRPAIAKTNPRLI